MPRFMNNEPLDSRLGLSNEIALAKISMPEAAQQFQDPDEAPRVQESTFDTSQVEMNSKASLDFLAALAMPLIFKYFFPPVFIAVWQWLVSFAHQTRKFPQLALGLPRGFGKTTVIKLFVLYCILFTKKQFILVICETLPKAVGIISDVCDMLDEPNIRKVFGDWKTGVEVDNQVLKKFGFRGRNIIIKAAGAETGIRGFNEKHLRPDVMIFDDIQSREASESEIQSDALMSWMLSTAMKSKSPEGCMFLFIANMYPTKGSILRKLKKNPMWTKFIVGGILEDGSSLWEDLQPLEQLLNEFENDLAAGHPEIFYAEVLNDEFASSNNLIDLNKLPNPPFEWDEPAAGKFIIVDPAAKAEKKSDAVSIGYFEVHASLPALREVDEDRMSPGESIRRALMMALKHGVRVIAVESTAYQSTYAWWFDYICKQYGISGIQCVEIYPGQRSKAARIMTMMQSYQKGEIFIHSEPKTIAHLQMATWKPMRLDNTDGVLDLLTYAPRVIVEFADLVECYTIEATQDWEHMEVIEHNSPF